MISVFAIIFEFFLLRLFRLASNNLPNTVYSLMILISTFALMADLVRSKRISYARNAILAGYFWRVFLLYFDIYGRSIYQLPNSGADSLVFFRQAEFYMTTGYVGIGGIFSTVMGKIFRITGASQLYGQYLIVLISVLALCLLARMMTELNLGLSVKRKTIGLLAFLPNYAIISSIFLRECPIGTLLALSFYCFYHWLEKGSKKGFILAFAFALAASTMHGGSAAAAVGYIAVVLLYDTKKKTFRLNARSLFPTILLSFGLVFLYVNYGETFFSKLTGVDSIEEIGSTYYSGGGSNYARFVGNSATPLNMLIFTIPRIVYFLFSPFPWQWRGISDIIAFIFSGLFYLITVVRAFRFLKGGRNDNKRVLIALLITVAAMTFVFAWGVTNTGTAARHREKQTILFGLIYAISSVPEQTRNKGGKAYK